MGVISTQGINFQLVAGDNVILDLFKDEDILLSDNVTGVFDLGVLPSDFTRQITLPGTKKNNAFFQHYYDISVYSPELFATNTKVPCYLDFGGIYLAQGYIQLTKVSLLANKFVDYYEVTIYGSLSSFARELNRSYLTDMTSSLAKFNHSASLETITGSWDNKLFSGSIVYPMAEYGQKILYLPQGDENGIETRSGSLFVQDYKPAIRIKEVWDAIFEEYGYTYSGSFWRQPFLNNVYMVLNNKLRYPIFEEVNLETYGLGKIGPVSGSTNILLSGSTAASSSFLPWYTIQSNPNNNFTQDIAYNLEYPSKLRGLFNLNFRVSGSDGTTSVPQFTLVIKDLQGNTIDASTLQQVNQAMDNLYAGNISVSPATPTKNEKYTILSEFNTGYLPSGSYRFFLNYSQLGTGNVAAIIDPGDELKSYLEITKVGNVGEGFSMNIGANMPFGTKGIKKIDFLTGIQKKFNLAIYPSKVKRNEFIVEPFNKWYKEGVQWDFNQFVNLNKPIDFIPANNFASNELQFGDKLDNDYISQQFSKQENREYGKTYYVDTTNFYSQGEFKVESSFASSPITYLTGTGLSGSVVPVSRFVSVSDSLVRFGTTVCLGDVYPTNVHQTVVTLLDTNGNPIINYGEPIFVGVRYDVSICNNPSVSNFSTIVIPYGASSAVREYDAVTYTRCTPIDCFDRTEDIDCVSSISPLSVQLAGTSPISSC